MKYKWEVSKLLGSGGFGGGFTRLHSGKIKAFLDVYKVKVENPPEGVPELGAMKTELINENSNPMMNRLKVELSILKIVETLSF